MIVSQKINKIFFLFITFIVVGCTSLDQRQTEEALPDLRNLTRQVEASVLYEGATLKDGQQALLVAAAADEPSHLQNLEKEYYVRPDIISGHAVVLLCTKDKAQALFEALACANQLPRRYYTEMPPKPCSFTYTPEDIKSLCGGS